ncbi:NAD-dependent protein deacylase 2 [Pseudomonas sp. 8Z]|uniref:NAD-dependent deacylase n=1 Tax=Pseudomonas sp. 8Z TaxID=2653166 RepID=UPI0012F09B1E|nr:NAD-dependent deacylase [Pseudomonas sp. 8Z]VXC40604.1 NAD-dependent protein deacylase 2 [Pseudomonas sp. 8Z]
MEAALYRVAQALARAERVLFITGAGLSADSGLPTYRGLGGLYNGRTEDGLPIEAVLSGAMLRRDPALCWKYLAELGGACLQAVPNAGHLAIAELQRRIPGCWVLTQNIDGYHRAAGSPAGRLIEIHGVLAPLFCQSCAAEDEELAAHLQRSLPPRCNACGGVLRPPVVLFEEMLPQEAIDTLYAELRKGFDLVLSVGTSSTFPYIVEPVLRTRERGGLAVEINPGLTALSAEVDVRLVGTALDVLPKLLGHISNDRICK